MERQMRAWTTIYLTVLLLVASTMTWGQTVQDYLNDGQRQYDRHDLQGALKSWQEGLDFARSTNNRSTQGTLLLNLGYVYEDLKNYPQAQNSYEEAVKLARELKDRVLEMRALNGCGTIYDVENHAQALTFYEQALTIARDLKDRAREVKILSNLGVAYEKLKNYSQAQSYYEQALQVAREIGDRDQESRALSNLRNTRGKEMDEILGFGATSKTVDDMMTQRRREMKQHVDHEREEEKHPHQALSAYQRDLQFARKRKDQGKELRALADLGHINIILKNYQQARILYEQALQLAQRLKLEALEVRALDQLGYIYQTIKNYSQAVNYYEQALQRVQEMKSRGVLAFPIQESSALRNLGVAYEYLNNDAQALVYYEQALQRSQELKSADMELEILDRIGDIHAGSGKYAQALTTFEQMLRVAWDNKNKPAELLSLTALTIVYSRLGDYAQALSFNERSFQMAKDLNDKDSVAVALNNQGTILLSLGNYDQARTCFEEELKLVSDLEDRSGKHTALLNLGTIFFELGDYPQAQSFYEKAFKLARKFELSTEQTEGNLGEVYLATGRHREAYEIFNRLNHQNRLGRYYLSRGEYAQAREKFAKMLDTRLRSRAENTLIESHIGLGKALEGLKKYGDAKTQYQQAVDLIDRQREKLTESQRQYFFGSKANGFFLLDAYEGLIRVSLHLQDATEGFFWAENTRARVLLETVARHAKGNRLGLPADLARQETDFISRFALISRQQEIAFKKQNSEQLSALTRDFVQLKDERNRFVTRLRTEHPAYAAIQYPQPLRVTDLTLKSDEVLLAYEVTETATFAWLVKRQQILKAVIIPVTRAKLTEKVLQYRNFFAGTKDAGQLSQFDPRMGKYLYDILFKDVASLLKDGDQLIIVPDEVLGILPFEALVTELPAEVTYASGAYGAYPTGVKYLGDQYAICYSQSASALVQTRSLQQVKQNKAERVLMIADPVFSSADTRLRGKTLLAKQESGDQVKLMRSIEESQLNRSNGTPLFDELSKIRGLAGQVKQLYGSDVEVLSGVNASESTLRKQPLADYRELIFATHGVLANEVATVREPALVFNQVGVNQDDPEQDGFLTLSEVMGLSLNADVAALIACNTGVGKTQTGEGVMGMGRAFQYAGAKSVLMSLWSVNEESTSHFAEQFFSQLKQGKDRLSALRFARTEIRKAGYEHPFFWAPFILVGES